MTDPELLIATVVWQEEQKVAKASAVIRPDEQRNDCNPGRGPGVSLLIAAQAVEWRWMVL